MKKTIAADIGIYLTLKGMKKPDKEKVCKSLMLGKRTFIPSVDLKLFWPKPKGPK